MAERAPTKRKRRPAVRLLRALILGPLALVLGFYLVCALALAAMRFLPPPITSVQVQQAIEALVSGDEAYDFRFDYVGRDRISEHAFHAVVAAEDTRFYQHHGIDWVELEKAREEARRRGRPPRGASTITQQFVKNLFLTTHRSYVRKGLEFPLALLADLILPKERLLELYLNVIEWGPGIYGVEAAAQHYYGTSAANLSRDQASRLAAVIPAPRSRTPDRMGGYAGTIRRRMTQMGW